MNVNKNLVNILTPVYNGAEYIPRLLDSVLIQTYPKVEMFVIDDGSTDNTEQVVASYIPRFEKKGYILHYTYQENAGQNAAINRALKWVNGEYLLYPDSDDWYKTCDAIAIMVDALNSYGSEVGVARCQFEMIEAETGKIINRTSFTPCDTPMDLFEDAYYGREGFYYAPIEFILKANVIDDYIKDREIFVNRHIGQNCQILLPYFANSKCVTINKVLGCYLVRKNSHSHTPLDYNNSLFQNLATQNCFEYTMSSLKVFKEDWKERLLKDKRKALCKGRMDLAVEYERTADFRKNYISYRCITDKIDVKYYRLWLWTFLFPIRLYKKCLRLASYSKLHMHKKDK